MNLINVLKKKNNINLFTTPSHAQKSFILSKFKQFYKYDISENDAYNPQDALSFSQKKAAEIYGTKSTFYLTNGSTSGIIAAVLTCVNQGEKVLIWDNAHPSHKNAVKLAGASPVFYELKKDEDWGIYTQTPPEIIEEKLKGVKEINGEKTKAVIITSPTYEGIVSDIKKIKEICVKYGAYLIVDEAHGALYPFCDELPTSAIYQGADFVIQSLHKTAGGLNPTALLHCNVDFLSAPSPLGGEGKFQNEARVLEILGEGYNAIVQAALDLISTTSPSYPMLASIEKNINFLNSKKGRVAISQLIKNIENMKKNVSSCEFYPQNDMTKILIKLPELSGFEFSEFLYKNRIEDERTNEKSTMLLCGIGTDIKKLKKLERVLR